MPSKVEILSAPNVGRGYSSTTAHGTKARGFVFVTGQVAVTPGQDGLKHRAAIGEMGTIEAQTIRCSRISRRFWRPRARRSSTS
jgi:enamine deaminase RidA (YjgF/YER057c/UK114 family)